jgi:hypothetical protein
MTDPIQPAGENVQPVRDAIEAMRTGKGNYDALLSAVQGARFAVRPTARTEEDWRRTGTTSRCPTPSPIPWWRRGGRRC